MLTLRGTRRTLCDGLNRRDLLQLGGLGLFGLSMADLFRLSAHGGQSAEQRPAGKARSCILLFPYGSPPQHETFDPKPDAPAEVQGELKGMPTVVSGLHICERLPRVAQVMDRVTVVRSVTHPFPVHGVAYAVSGIPTYTPDLETRPHDSRHYPFIGSIVDYLDSRRTGVSVPPVPRNVALPWMLNSKTDFKVNAGPFAAFLGQGYDPVWTDMIGQGTRLAPKYSEGQPRAFMDPFAGITPDSQLTLSPEAQPTPDVSVERLNLRQSLLRQMDAGRLQVEATAAGHDRFQRMAFSLLTSNRMRQALDIGKEPLPMRERYGMTLFGQSCLAARRLVEAGCRFVTVFWDGYGQFGGCAWDTHSNHYPRLKEYLLPGFDLAYSALIEDLTARGLLDETLVLWLSEHGRTPRIDSKPKGAGRHHWSKAYSVALAGGGVPGGKVVGSTDRQGGEVRDTPVSPKDLLATTFHLLGIDANTTVPDLEGRPVPIAGSGEVRKELLG